MVLERPDDKGGDAVIVAALRAMQQAGTLKNADITVFLTGDEEDAGKPIEVARQDLIAAGKRADVALDFEGLVRDRRQGHGLDVPTECWQLDSRGESENRAFERYVHDR